MEKVLARGIVFLVLVIALQACGVGGGGGSEKNGNTPVATSTNGSSGTADDAGSTTGSGPTDPGSPGTTTPGGTPATDGTGGTGDTTPTPTPIPVDLPGRITVNLNLNCPSDENSIVGCWVSEVCHPDASPDTSYRDVLWFDADKTLKTMHVLWGAAGCPAEIAPSGVTQDASMPDYFYGAQVETTTVGIVGHLLDINQGKIKTVVGEILQLRQYNLQRMCFHESHYNSTTGLGPTAQRADDGPYVIDSTLCLQRHLD